MKNHITVEDYKKTYHATGRILEDAESFGLFSHISESDVEKSKWIMAIITVLNDLPKRKIRKVFRDRKIKFNFMAFIAEQYPRKKRVRYSKSELAEMEREATLNDYQLFYQSVIAIYEDMAAFEDDDSNEDIVVKCQWVASLLAVFNDTPKGRATHILGYREINFNYDQFVEEYVSS